MAEKQAQLAQVQTEKAKLMYENFNLMKRLEDSLNENGDLRLRIIGLERNCNELSNLRDRRQHEFRGRGPRQ